MPVYPGALRIARDTSETLNVEYGTTMSRSFRFEMISGVNPEQAFSDYREFPVVPQLVTHFLCFWVQIIFRPTKYLSA